MTGTIENEAARTVENEGPRSGSRRRRSTGLIRVLAVAATMAAAAIPLGIGDATPAQAVNQYTVTANSPKPAAACNNHGTVPAGGWLANKPCGYIMGTALAGTRFDVNDTSGSNWHYGRTRGANGKNFCTWLMPAALDLGSRSSVPASCSAETRSTMAHRLSFGRDFDAAPHTGNGAIVVPINPAACPGYYNYFDSSSFDSGTLRDPVGFALPTAGGYRYTSKDGQASVIRVKDASGETIWMFVARSCIESQLPANLNNEND